MNINKVVHLANKNNAINKNDIESINSRINEVWKLLISFAKQAKK